MGERPQVIECARCGKRKRVGLIGRIPRFCSRECQEADVARRRRESISRDDVREAIEATARLSNTKNYDIPDDEWTDDLHASWGILTACAAIAGRLAIETEEQSDG